MTLVPHVETLSSWRRSLSLLDVAAHFYVRLMYQESVLVGAGAGSTTHLNLGKIAICDTFHIPHPQPAHPGLTSLQLVQHISVATPAYFDPTPSSSPRSLPPQHPPQQWPCHHDLVGGAILKYLGIAVTMSPGTALPPNFKVTLK